MPSKHCQWSKCIQVQVKKHNKPSLRFSLSLFSCSHIYFSATLISNVMKTTPQALQKIGRKRKMKLKQHLGELNELHFLVSLLLPRILGSVVQCAGYSAPLPFPRVRDRSSCSGGGFWEVQSESSVQSGHFRYRSERLQYLLRGESVSTWSLGLL